MAWQRHGSTRHKFSSFNFFVWLLVAEFHFVILNVLNVHVVLHPSFPCCRVLMKLLNNGFPSLLYTYIIFQNQTFLYVNLTLHVVACSLHLLQVHMGTVLREVSMNSCVNRNMTISLLLLHLQCMCTCFIVQSLFMSTK